MVEALNFWSIEGRLVFHPANCAMVRCDSVTERRSRREDTVDETMIKGRRNCNWSMTGEKTRRMRRRKDAEEM